MKWGMPGMTRGRCFFNRGLVMQNFRQHGWIGIIYACGLFFAVPLQILLTNDLTLLNQKYSNLFQLGDGIQGALITFAPLATGLLLSRYLQVKAPADLWHSLPLRREHLLTSHFLSGAILLLIPIWLTTGMTALANIWSGYLFDFSAEAIWQWGIAVSVISLFIFCFTVFVGICTGQSVLQGIVSCILLLLPYVLMQFISFYFSLYLYGYPYGYFTSSVRTDLWSPIVHLFSVNHRAFGVGELCVYTTMTLVIIALCYLLYRKRHSEIAGQAIAFSYFNPLFKAGVMLCCMLVAGNYFAMNMNGKIGWTFAGYMIGAVIGFAASEMVMRKSWHILNRKVSLHFVVYTLLLGSLLYLPISGWTGYEARVPKIGQISEVYAGSLYNLYAEKPNELNPYVQYSPFSKIHPLSDDADYIEAVQKLHSTIAVIRPKAPAAPSFFYDTRVRTMNMVYCLANGRRLIREYQVPIAGFEPELRAVMETEGYKRTEYVLPQLEGPVQKINISTREGVIVLTKTDDINEFKDLLRQEILAMSYEDQVGDNLPLASIELPVTTSDRNEVTFFSYSLLPSYHKLLAWMADKGYDKFLIKPKDISSIEIAAFEPENVPNAASYYYNPDKYMALARQENRTIVTEDKKSIGAVLDRQKSFSVRKGTYLVKENYVNGSPDYVLVESGSLPLELKQQLR